MAALKSQQDKEVVQAILEMRADLEAESRSCFKCFNPKDPNTSRGVDVSAGRRLFGPEAPAKPPCLSGRRGEVPWGLMGLRATWSVKNRRKSVGNI